MHEFNVGDVRQFLAEELDARSTVSDAATLASLLGAYFFATADPVGIMCIISPAPSHPPAH